MEPSTKSYVTPIELYRAISLVWSAETSSPTGVWSPAHPAMNHCSVTSLVVQDYFGGEILCTKTVGGNHFYNLIGTVKWDLTASQFLEPIPYDDLLTSRDSALADTTNEKYALIKQRLANNGDRA